MDTAVIAAVVVLNAIVGFAQEGKAERALQAIRHLLAPHATVLRDGRAHDIDAAGLVPGDVVLLASGDSLPADVRLLEAGNLHVDESALTGESVPVAKHTGPVDAAAAIGDRLCMGYAGTLVTQGQAKAVVVATGAATEIGRIGRMLETVEPGTTPLLQRMAVFGRRLTLVILATAALLFVFGTFVRGMPAGDMFMAAVGLAVAAIPEGLPAILTITLAIGVQRMARRHALIRRLPAVETLSGFLVWRIVLVSALFLAGIFGMFARARALGADLDTAHTVAVNTLVCMEVFYLFSVRYLKSRSFTWQGVRGTPRVLTAVAAVFALQLAFTYAPPMQALFHTADMPPALGLQVLGVGVALLLLLEVEKAVLRIGRRSAGLPGRP